MRILLLHPPKTHQVWAGVPRMFNDRFAYLFPPLAVMYLSSYLKKNTSHEVQVIDGVVDNLSFPELGRRIGQWQPDVVGVSATATHNMVNVAKAIEQVRRVCPQAFVVMGGQHVNSFPEQSIQLRGVDAAIRGDGEIPLTRLLTTLEESGDIASVPNIILRRDDGSIFRSEELPVEDNLDVYPFPDRVACPPGQYHTPGMRWPRATTMISSRGCPHRCVFCNVPHGYRDRSPDNVVDEMEICANEHRIQDIHFVDDLFNLTPQRVMAISERVIERGVKIAWGYKASVRQTNREMIKLAKQAGCYRMHYGVETVTDEGLEALNKKVTIDEIKRIFKETQEEGVKAIAYMIIGCPHEKSEEQIMQAHRFTMDLAPDYVVYSLFTPYPDAPIFVEGVKKGLWKEDVWEKFMVDPKEDFDLPTAWEEHLGKKDLLRLFKLVNRRFYFHPRTLWRILTGMRTWSELRRTILGGISLLRMELLRPGEREI